MYTIAEVMARKNQPWRAGEGRQGGLFAVAAGFEGAGAVLEEVAPGGVRAGGDDGIVQLAR